NWTPVQGGELLSAVGAPEIRASVPGRILFPKYPRPSEPPPPELFRLAVPVEDPNRLFAPRWGAASARRRLHSRSLEPVGLVSVQSWTTTQVPARVSLDQAPWKPPGMVGSASTNA